MTKIYQGTCHCKRVAFEADIDLAQAPSSATAPEAPVRYLDGLHDNWFGPPPEETRHL